jgi:hypothetical protein
MGNNDQPMPLEQLNLNIARLNHYIDKPSTTEEAKAWYRQEIQRLESENAKLLGDSVICH